MKLPIVSNLFKTKTDEAYLGLIVGSHAVKATIFAPPSELEVTAKILGHSEQKQGITSMRGCQVLDLDALLETTDLSLEQAKIAAGIWPKKTLLGVFGGAILNLGMMVKLTRTNLEAAISQKELNFLLDKIKEKTVPQATSEIENLKSGNLVHLDTFLTRYKLDGKAIDSPLGLSGQVLEAALVHTFSDAADLKTWQIFAKELGLNLALIVDSSFLWALPLFDKLNEGVLIDIGADATAVLVFKNGKLYGSQTFCLGGKTLTEEIAQKLSVSFDQAEDLKLKFQAGQLDQERVTQIREVMGKILEIWVEGLEAALIKLQKKLTPVPSNFLLCGGGARLGEVKSALLTHPWGKTINFSAFPKVENLDESTIYQGLSRISSLIFGQD